MNPKYTITTDGLTVTDSTTNLMWDRTTLGGGRMTHGNALAAADEYNAANYLGHADWRVPTVGELQSIVDHNKRAPAIDIDAFPGTQSVGYWTATDYAPNPAGAWIVHFGYGDTGASVKTNGYFVRLVRSGQ